MKTLIPGRRIRLQDWNTCTSAIFNSVRAIAARDGHEPALSFSVARQRGHDTAFSVYAGSMITSDKSYYARIRAEADGAVTLFDGEVVMVEGEPEFYRVKVVSGNLDMPRNSDPIHFEAVDAVIAESHDQVVWQMDGREVTRGEAARIFDRVKDGQHWKNPIDARVALTAAEQRLLEFAVPFFCGCAVEIFPTGKRQVLGGRNEIFRVMAAGYFETVGA